MDRKESEDRARFLLEQTLVEYPDVAKLDKVILDYDSCLWEHCHNVAFIAAQVCFSKGLGIEQTKKIISGALLHDIGKIKISPRILNKAQKLTEDEYLEIKNHPIYGVGILALYDLPEEVNQIVRSHHEKMDGTGYPDGLTTIPYAAKIVSAIDAYDAMTAMRSYGKVRTAAEAIKQLNEEGNFSPSTIKNIEFCKAK